MMELLIRAGLGMFCVVIAAAIFTGLVWFGFRLGRITTGKPLPPVIGPKVVNMVEEDPFHKPMTGEDQPSYPTVDEEKS